MLEHVAGHRQGDTCERPWDLKNYEVHTSFLDIKFFKTRVNPKTDHQNSACFSQH